MVDGTEQSTLAEPEDFRKNSYSGTLDALSKAAAVILLCAYGAGYITISIYYSTLGMGLVNPLKPQILAAGILLILLTFSPAWVTYQIFNLEELRRSVESWDYFTKLTIGASELLTASASLAIPAQILFVTTANPSKWNTTAYISVIAVNTSAWLLLSKLRSGAELTRRLPWVSWVVINSGILVWVSLCLGSGPGFSQRKIALWFFACGILLLLTVSPNFTGPQRRDWPYQSLQVLVLLAAFPTYIYPHIPSKWGGGQPIDAIVTFSKDSVIQPLASLRVRLIEEDDNGIYVIPTSGKKATSIPKASIGAILFSENPDDRLK